MRPTALQRNRTATTQPRPGIRPGPLRDLADERDIRTVVKTFFAEARRDLLLSAVFDSVQTDGGDFVAAMSGFWSSLLFQRGLYCGHPCDKHEMLGLTAAHFERWRELFFKAVDTHFSGASAEELKFWAVRVGGVFQERLAPTPRNA